MKYYNSGTSSKEKGMRSSGGVKKTVSMRMLSFPMLYGPPTKKKI